MLRTFGSVLAGWATVSILMILTDTLLGKLFPGAFSSAGIPPYWLAAVRAITGAVYSMLGGWVTARLAPSDPWKHALGLILFGGVLGMVAVVVSLGSAHWWYPVVLLFIWPVAVSAGCWAAAGPPPFLSRRPRPPDAAGE